MKKKVWLFICILCYTMLSSCAASSDKQKTAVESIPLSQDTLEQTPDFSYEVINQTPYILIDKVGYMPDRKKTVFILGNDLDSQFSVRHGTTGETVYQGTLQKVGESGRDNKSIYMGDFTGLTANGIYEIYQEQVGYSYPFYINKMVYRNVSTLLYDEIESYSFEKTSDLCYTLSNIMLTNEIYKDTQENKAFLKEQISRLLLQQDEKTGAVCQLLGDSKNTGEDISLCATAETAGVLEQYYYNYKDDDFPFAVSCLNASTRAYRYMEKYRDNINTDSWYFASSQLYRITGQYKYKAAIQEYDEFPEDLRTLSEYDYTMLADIAYLSTTYRADLIRCQKIMDGYMERAQEISEESSKDHYYVMKKIDTISEKQLLKDMMVLGVVNYVLSGREYAVIQENHIHYFFGVNESAKNRLTEEYASKISSKQKENGITKISEFIFVLGNVSQK